MKLKELLSALRGEYLFHIVVLNGEKSETLCLFDRFAVFTSEAFDPFDGPLTHCRHFNGIIYSDIMQEYGDHSVVKFSFVGHPDFDDTMNILIAPSAELVPELPESLEEWFEQLHEYWNKRPEPKEEEELPF